MTIADNIRRLRHMHGETQEELGRAIGVSAMAVSQWENNRAAPRMGMIERMARHWDTKKSEIIDGVNIPNEITLSLSQSEFRLINQFRDLNDLGRNKVLDFTDDLISSGKYEKLPGGSPSVSA